MHFIVYSLPKKKDQHVLYYTSIKKKGKNRDKRKRQKYILQHR